MPADWLAPGTPRTGLRAPLRSPMPSLHSASQVSSLRGTEWCDQSGVEFSAKGLRTQRHFRRIMAGAHFTRSTLLGNGFSATPETATGTGALPSKVPAVRPMAVWGGRTGHFAFEFQSWQPIIHARSLTKSLANIKF